MPRFSHILTGIPPGSHVVVKSQGRFAQFDEVVRSGAIGITANKVSYPIVVNVRPTQLGTAGYAGGLKVRVDMGSPLVQWRDAEGGTFDVTLHSVFDFNPSKIEHYLPFDKRVGPWLDAAAVKAVESEATRIFNTYKCQGCGVNLDENRKFCASCDVRTITCEHPSIGSLALKECGNPIYPGYGACREHLVLMGVAFKKRRGGAPKVRTVPNLLPVEERKAGPFIGANGRSRKGTKRRYTKRPKPITVCVVD